MKIFKYKDREAYFEAQIERSQEKGNYCKVYFSDVIRYRQLIEMDKKGAKKGGDRRPRSMRILCLGVRTGAELDLFRAVFRGPLFRFRLIHEFAQHRDTVPFGDRKIQLAKRLGIGSGSPGDGRVMGVEINPAARRQDIWIGSFDELPNEWENQFDVIYSNSIDHSQNPEQTVAEWKRVAAPGAYVILGFAENNSVSHHDPFGGFGYMDLQKLWDAPIVFLSDTYNQNGYKEICFRLTGRHDDDRAEIDRRGTP